MDGRSDQRGDRHRLTDRAVRGATAVYAPRKILPAATAMTMFARPGLALDVHTVIRAAATADTANCTDAAAPHTLRWRQGELTTQHALNCGKLLNVLTAALRWTESVWGVR